MWYSRENIVIQGIVERSAVRHKCRTLQIKSEISPQCPSFPRNVTFPNMSICEERTHKGVQGVSPLGKGSGVFLHSRRILVLFSDDKEPVGDVPQL